MFKIRVRPNSRWYLIKVPKFIYGEFQHYENSKLIDIECAIGERTIVIRFTHSEAISFANKIKNLTKKLPK